mmetsp:Transcript_23313/g.39443  ORF Transcript_23313/g.39443 Transcript_23313/m.39443 type:complete len:282 (-) Transcript_23313:122-967(-)
MPNLSMEGFTRSYSLAFNDWSISGPMDTATSSKAGEPLPDFRAQMPLISNPRSGWLAMVVPLRFIDFSLSSIFFVFLRSSASGAKPTVKSVNTSRPSPNKNHKNTCFFSEPLRSFFSNVHTGCFAKRSASFTSWKLAASSDPTVTFKLVTPVTTEVLVWWFSTAPSNIWFRSSTSFGCLRPVHAALDVRFDAKSPAFCLAASIFFFTSTLSLSPVVAVVKLFPNPFTIFLVRPSTDLSLAFRSFILSTRSCRCISCRSNASCFIRTTAARCFLARYARNTR